MLGGSIVIETIFQINGLGYLAWKSIQRKDLPTMQAIVLSLSVIYVLLTLFADLLNAFPRSAAEGGIDGRDEGFSGPASRQLRKSSRRRRARCCVGASCATGAC